ncbi:MAG TPA: hypothetical protein VGQ22_12175 [Steroidobacteraceae bacterium]|nr:hypothetical protein [Steroidobacteraceae bacterium]
MRRLTTTLAAAALLTCACTMVRVNSDETSTIEHKGGVEVGRDLANRACRRAGQDNAEIISTVNKNPDLPPETGKQVTTFKCSGAKTR